MNLFDYKLKLFPFKCWSLSLFLVLIITGSCENQLIENVVLTDKTIALTFDDGPDPIYTDMILDVLKEKDVKATFFLIGKRMEQYPLITQRIFEEGHCLANHTYGHFDLKKRSYSEMYNSVLHTEDILTGICGVSMKIFRPPWGHITKGEQANLENYGFTVVLWDINSGDYKSKAKVDEIIDNVMKNVGNKKIVLFHDSDYLGKASRQNTVLALPKIIDMLKDRGYRFETINQMENVRYQPLLERPEEFGLY